MGNYTTPWEVISNAINKRVTQSREKKQAEEQRERDLEFATYQAAIQGELSKPNPNSDVIDGIFDRMRKNVPKDSIPLVEAYKKVIGMVHKKKQVQQVLRPQNGGGPEERRVAGPGAQTSPSGGPGPATPSTPATPPTPGRGPATAAPAPTPAAPGASTSTPPLPPGWAIYDPKTGEPVKEPTIGQTITRAIPTPEQTGEVAGREEAAKSGAIAAESAKRAENLVKRLQDANKIDPQTGKPTAPLTPIETDILAQGYGFKLPANAVAPRGSGFMRSLGKVSMLDAKQRADRGEQFVGIDGQPIDVTTYDDDMALVAVGQGGNLFYVPVSQAEKQVTVGNNVIAVPEFNLPQATTGGGTVLGPKQVPTTSMRSIPGINTATGKRQDIQVPTTRTPQTLAIPSRGQATRGAPTAPAGGTTAAPAVPPELRKPKGKGKPPAGSKAQITPGAEGFTPPANIPLTQYQQYAKPAQSVRMSRNSIIGDNPNQIGGLAADLNVFDDPDSINRLSKYIGFINQHLVDEGGEPKGGGPLAYLEWYGGLPTRIVEQQQKAAQQLSIDLTEPEQKFVEDYYRAVGTIGGMRSSVGGSTGQWFFNTLRSELPTPGSVTNKKDAVARLKNLLQETNVVGALQPLVGKIDVNRLDAVTGKRTVTGPTTPSPMPKSEADRQAEEWLRTH